MKRLITLQPGEVYRFSVAVPDIEGASLAFGEDGTPGQVTVGRGQSVEISVECKPAAQAASLERKIA